MALLLAKLINIDITGELTQFLQTNDELTHTFYYNFNCSPGFSIWIYKFSKSS